MFLVLCQAQTSDAHQGNVGHGFVGLVPGSHPLKAKIWFEISRGWKTATAVHRLVCDAISYNFFRWPSIFLRLVNLEFGHRVFLMRLSKVVIGDRVFLCDYQNFSSVTEFIAISAVVCGGLRLRKVDYSVMCDDRGWPRSSQIAKTIAMIIAKTTGEKNISSIAQSSVCDCVRWFARVSKSSSQLKFYNIIWNFLMFFFRFRLVYCGMWNIIP